MRLLRNTLRANGIYSTVAGGAVAALAGPLAERMKVASIILLVVGVGTLAFGVAILWATRHREVGHGFALAVIAADVVWVIGAAAVLLAPRLISDKWMLLVVSVPVALFAVLQIIGLKRASVETPRLLQTEVVIAAPRAAVWDTLSGFDEFDQWNPFITSASGTPEPGAPLELRMAPPGGMAVSLKPVVTRVKADEELEWLGRLGPEGVFDGRHRFELESVGTKTRMIHAEEFTGILVPMLWKWLDTKTRAGFEAMNRALKEKVETTVQTAN